VTHSFVRSTTASTKTFVVATVAILSLMLSLFAFARPVAADHSGFDHQPLPIDTSTFAHETAACDGADLEPGQVLLHWIASHQNVTETITLTLVVEGTGELTADSYKWNEPANVAGNVTHHFELIVDADVVVEDLDISTGEGNVRLSHVCRGEEAGGGGGGGEDDDASLNIFKVDEDTRQRLEGAIFEIEGMTGTFETDANGQICITGLPEDTEWLVREIQAPEGYEIIEAEQLVEVDDDGDCDSPDAVFENRQSDGENPGEQETVAVSIMKHLCTDVSTVDEFEAVEAAGAAAYPGNPAAPLAFSVVACPTIVLTGDVPTSGAVSGGNLDFDFTVVDASGTQVLSTDGTFEAGALCESDVNVDADGSGTIDADVCLDTSHYTFEVVDGVVTITETEMPAGSTGVGTLRFTPGSGDETALATSIADVEATGVIMLDTSMASDAALADGMIMLHVYNFASVTDEGEQPGTGGPGGGEVPGENETPRLPNTATSPAGSGSAAQLAFLMLIALGIAGSAVRAEARRRR
jgi:hypothetical protein